MDVISCYQALLRLFLVKLLPVGTDLANLPVKVDMPFPLPRMLRHSDDLATNANVN